MLRKRNWYRRPIIRVAPPIVNVPAPIVIPATSPIGLRLWKHPDFLWRCLEVFGFAIAAFALFLAVKANEYAVDGLAIARTEAQEGRLINAWQILTNPATGNSGKIQALETVFQSGQPLIAIDLSCATMGGVEGQYYNCNRPTYLRGINLYTEAGTSADLSKADLSGADIRGSNLREVVFDTAEMNGTLLNDTDLQGASFINASLNWAEWDGANISGVKFCGLYPPFEPHCASGLMSTSLRDAWAWEDMPPILSFSSVSVEPDQWHVCDPALRPAYEEIQAWGKPKGC